MPRRIEIELTSKVDDDTWTWRAAGARQPKGRLAAKVLPGGAKLGDVLRAEVEDDLDGIAVLQILPTKEKAPEPERLVLLPPEERRAPSPPPARSDRRDRDRPSGGKERSDRPRRDRPERSDRAERGDRPARPDRPDRPDRPKPDKRAARPARAARPKPEAPPERPKPKKLNPGHTHRNSVLAALPPEKKPIAEQLLKGGLPAVRQAIDTQNALLKADNQATINAGPLLNLAEELLPAIKTAEWLDRAEAAGAAGDDISLRDLRSVVSGSEVARDEAARLLAGSLREALDARLKRERDQWVTEIGDALTASRTVRALRIASRPPDPAMRFPADLGARLAEAASAGMAAEVPPERWLAVLDAVSVSPVRRAVQPAGLPADPSPEFLSTVKQAVPRVPALGPLVGIDASQVPPPPRPRPPGALPRRRPPGAAAPAAEASTPAENGEAEQSPKSTEETVTAADS